MLLCKTIFAAVVCLATAGALAQTSPAPATSTTTDTNTNTAPSAPPAFTPQVPTPATPAAVQTPVAAQQGTTSPTPVDSTGAAQVSTGGTRVHGTIMDPDGALIPGATVTMTPQKGSAVKATAGGDGTYSVTVAPGRYTFLVTMPGFATYSVTNLRIPAAPALTVDAKMALGEMEQVVNVEASNVQVSVDADANASATILTGKDLDALSDDPDELQSELTALAGPSAGPNGGQIYVDGFTGGQLPPKSSIREIRINQNPFSAQFDKLGYGRIEVFTKPGTDKFHGSFQVNGNPSQFNSGKAPNQMPGLVIPPYHTVFMFGSLSGPISKWASFNIGGSHRDIEDDSYTNGTIAALAGTTALCPPGNSACVAVPYQASTYTPQIRTDVSPRIDLSLGEKNVLTTRFQYVQNDLLNQGIGTFTLPESAYNSHSTNFELQMSDTQTWSSRLINETRFEYERDRSNTTPLSSSPNVSVSGFFTSGGYSGQRTSDHQDHFEVQNYTSLQTKKNFFRFGGRLRSTREAQYPGNGINGSFTYTSINYVNTCLLPGAPVPCTPPLDNSYATGTPSQFSQTVVHAPVNFTVADLGLYAETDWKPLPNLTVSYGLRFETQNHWNDHADVAPRASFAYGLGKASKAPKTVIRGGLGIFYDRFQNAQVLNLAKEDGVHETVTTIRNPTSLPGGTCAPSTPAYCTGTGSGATTYSVAGRQNSPYILQFALGTDQQLGKIGKVSVNYIHSLGVHALAAQNSACNPNAVGVCQNISNINFQYFTEGQFHENQLMANANFQVSRWLSLGGFYSLIGAQGDNSGATSFISTPGNIRADIGRTTFDVRSREFLYGSITLPHYIQLSPFVIGQSGNPYNVTEGQDINNDGIFNDRPYLLPSGLTAAQIAALGGKTIAGCGSFLSRTTTNPVPTGSVIAPINDCTGPALFTFNLRATKTFGFGGNKDGSPASASGSGRGSGSGTHQHGGGGPGGGGPGGGPGMFGGGGSNTGQRYNLAIGVQLQNLFGNNDYATPIGTLTSPDFGRSNQLQGGPYTTVNATRRISLQASFNF